MSEMIDGWTAEKIKEFWMNRIDISPRFLEHVIEKIQKLEEERSNLRLVLRKARQAIKAESNCDGGQGCWNSCKHEQYQKIISSINKFLSETQAKKGDLDC